MSILNHSVRCEKKEKVDIPRQQQHTCTYHTRNNNNK